VHHNVARVTTRVPKLLWQWFVADDFSSFIPLMS